MWLMRSGQQLTVLLLAGRGPAKSPAWRQGHPSGLVERRKAGGHRYRTRPGIPARQQRHPPRSQVHEHPAGQGAPLPPEPALLSRMCVCTRAEAGRGSTHSDAEHKLRLQRCQVTGCLASASSHSSPLQQAAAADPSHTPTLPDSSSGLSLPSCRAACSTSSGQASLKEAAPCRMELPRLGMWAWPG